MGITRSVGANGDSSLDQLPPEVLAFATAHQVDGCLGPLLAATQRLFPTANWLKVRLEEDPELRDDRHIVFDVQLTGWDAARASESRGRWIRDLLHVCPQSLADLFRLLLDLRP